MEYCKKAGGKNIATVHAGSNLMLRTCYLPSQWKHNVTVCDAKGAVKEGDLVVITKGDYVNAQGGTNTMKIVRVGADIR